VTLAGPANSVLTNFVNPMATESKLDEAKDILTKIVKEQIERLPAAVALSKREKLRELAITFSERGERNHL